MIGTSSSGKTTTAHGVMHKLKLAGLNADGLFQQDRRLGFDRELLESDPIAQWSIIMNQIKTEADMMLDKGVDIMVSDRSPLDFYAYYETMYDRNQALLNLVIHWCKTTFKALYYCPPLKYHDDGTRPPEDFRDRVDATLRTIMAEELPIWQLDTYAPTLFVDVPLDEIAGHILKQQLKVLKDEDLELIPKVLGESVLIGGSYAFNRANKFSDVDVYVLRSTSIPTGDPSLQVPITLLQDVLGVRVEMRGVGEVAWAYLRKQGFKELLC